MAQELELLFEGKGKRIYRTENPSEAILYFKDEAIAFNGLKRGRIIGKGEINNEICRHLFTMLRENGIENHFIRQLDSRRSLVRRVDIIPVSVVVRNRVAGRLASRIGLPVGTLLKEPVVEFCLKSDELDNPMINFSHIRALEIMTRQEADFITETALKINGILSSYMKEINIELIDFRLEFGRYEGKILLADEISPDVARFWDAGTHEPMDIDRFRQNLGEVEESYHELLHRMMGQEKE